MKKGSAIILIAVIIATFIIGAFAGIYFLKYKVTKLNEEVLPKPSPIQTSNPTQSPAADETASWKKYKSKFGYEIKYPMEWSESHESNAFQSGDEIAFKFTEQIPSEGGGFPPGAILILANPESFKGTSLKDWYNNKNPSPQVPVNLLETTLNGLNVLKISHGDGSNITYYIQEKGKIYAINYAYTVVSSGKLTQAYYSKLFDQILSTFKFE